MGSMRRLRGLCVVFAAVGLLALVLGGSAVGATRAPHREAKQSLSLKVVLVRNRQILATGKAHPVPARGRVVLQLRRNGAWHRLGRHPLGGHGGPPPRPPPAPPRSRPPLRPPPVPGLRPRLPPPRPAPPNRPAPPRRPRDC